MNLRAGMLDTDKVTAAPGPEIHIGGSSAIGIGAYGTQFRMASMCGAATALRAGVWALLLWQWPLCPRYGHT